MKVHLTLEGDAANVVPLINRLGDLAESIPDVRVTHIGCALDDEASQQELLAWGSGA